MLGILAFLLGICLVILSIPVKTIQLAATATKLKLKKDSIKEKHKSSKLTKGVNKLKAKFGIGNNNKNKKKNKVLETIKLKAVELIALALKGLSSVLFMTGQSLMMTGIIGSLILLLVIVALIAACASVVIFIENSDLSVQDTISSSDDAQTAYNLSIPVQLMSEWYVNHVATNKGVYIDGTQSEAAKTYYNSVKNDVSKFYRQQVTDIEYSNYYYCDLIDAYVKDDDYGYMCALASFICGRKITIDTIGNAIEPQDKYLIYRDWDIKNFGFRQYTFEELGSAENLITGDFLVNSDGDIRVFVDTAHIFDWKYTHKFYPLKATTTFYDTGYLITYTNETTEPVTIEKLKPFDIVYRYEGAQIDYSQYLNTDENTEENTEEETEEKTEENTEEETEEEEDPPIPTEPIDVELDEDIKAQLMRGGMDEASATRIAVIYAILEPSFGSTLALSVAACTMVEGSVGQFELQAWRIENEGLKGVVNAYTSLASFRLHYANGDDYYYVCNDKSQRGIAVETSGTKTPITEEAKKYYNILQRLGWETPTCIQDCEDFTAASDFFGVPGGTGTLQFSWDRGKAIRQKMIALNDFSTAGLTTAEAQQYLEELNGSYSYVLDGVVISYDIC